tara:strand:+ start:844 stop:1635 length:792 start_codon:yes stop_codon:yes gene_type:complete
MGGMGSGVKGSGEGVYIQVYMEAGEAISSASKLDGKVNEVTESFKQMQLAGQEFSGTAGDVTAGYDDMADGTKNLEESQLKAMVGMTMVVSGLNQLTGSLYKTIGGLEAAGVINEDQARAWQKNARMVELFTGPLEFAISLMILYQAASLPMVASLWAKVPAFSAVGASAMTAAVGVWAFMAPLLPFIAVALIVVGVIFLIMSNLDLLTKGIGLVTDGFKAYLEIIMGVVDMVTGLTSSFSALGDAFTDNPVTKMLSKAGGVF